MHIHVHRRHYGRVVLFALVALVLLFLLFWGFVSCTTWAAGRVGDGLEDGPEPTPTIDLPTPGALVVSVLNVQQTPIPNMQVSVEGPVLRTSFTDGNGDAYFQELPPDYYRVSQVLPPDWWTWYGRSIVIRVTEGQTSYWTFEDEPLPATPVPETATPVPTPVPCKTCHCYKDFTPTAHIECN